MLDGKSVIEQVEKLQLIYHKLSVEDITISEPFQEATMIAKLLLSWQEFKKYLKHKQGNES